MFSKQRNLETLQGRLGFCVQELGHCDTHLEVVIGYLWYRQEDHPAIVLASVNEALKEVLQVIEKELLALNESDQTLSTDTTEEITHD